LDDNRVLTNVNGSKSDEEKVDWSIIMSYDEKA
jgi:hypothetical protein